jgi:hypothetical protein
MNKNYLNSKGNWDIALGDQLFLKEIVDLQCKAACKENHHQYLSFLQNFMEAGSHCSFLELLHHPGIEPIF